MELIETGVTRWGDLAIRFGRHILVPNEKPLLLCDL